MKQSESDPFLDAVRERLDRSADELDELTLARLGAARRRAVEAAGRRNPGPLGDLLAMGRAGHRRWWLSGSLLLLLAAAWLGLNRPAGPGMGALPLVEDLAILGSAEELEFYRDIDFYLWASGEPDKD